MNRFFALLTALLLLVLACSLSGAATSDLAATETAIAAQVMTQLAPTPTTHGQVAQTPTYGQVSDLPPTTDLPPTHPGPPFNPFEDLTAEEEACLRAAWGDEAYAAIITFRRPPSPEEAQALMQCDIPAPGWSLVPGWTSYPGSMPDVIRRSDTIYIYTPGTLVRYHLDTGLFDGPMRVTIRGVEMFVDPSAFIDDEGRLVLFFLYGQRGGDPAGCLPQETTCEKRFGSATEVEGSDGARQLDANDWSIILSGTSLGLTGTTNVESAGFAVNTP